MAQERDRSSYCHKPIVQRRTTPSYHGGSVRDIGQVWRSDQGRPRQHFPLQSSQVQVVSCFSAASPRQHLGGRGGLYIGVFRSTPSIWDQDGRHRSYEAQTSLCGAAWPGAHATWSCLDLIGSLMCFFSCWFPGKIILALFEFWKVPET
jgi:hypothetical protein